MTKAPMFPLSFCILLLALFVTPFLLAAQEAPKPTPSDQATFDVIGIAVQTNNATEANADGQIPKLWQRLFMEGVLNRIPDRSDEAIVAVYTKYATDANGDYTCILGAKVAPGTKAPEGMVAVTVPAGKYLEFVSAKGPGQEVRAGDLDADLRLLPGTGCSETRLQDRLRTLRRAVRSERHAGATSSSA